METELVISHVGFPPLSARGCSQELVPLALGQFRRTINGDLVFLGVQGKKYKTIITCEDRASFASDELLPGMVVDVQCIQRLWQKIEGSQVVLDRYPVEKSLCAITEERDPMRIICFNGKEITLDNQKVGYVSYRPVLKMRVTRFGLTTDEWGAKAGWRLELEEV